MQIITWHMWLGKAPESRKHTATRTSRSLWPFSLLDHIFVSNLSGDQERLRCTICSVSGSLVPGVIALTVKSNNVFISNFLFLITYKRAISWFLLPHFSGAYSIWCVGNRDIMSSLTWLPSLLNTLKLSNVAFIIKKNSLVNKVVAWSEFCCH